MNMKKIYVDNMNMKMCFQKCEEGRCRRRSVAGVENLFERNIC